MLTLGPGERLDVWETRTDEEGRFELVLQGDGNLVVYGYSASEPECKALWASHTTRFGEDVQLHMNPGGWFEILTASNGWSLWQAPAFVSGEYGMEPSPHCVQNSELHLQSDGNLVVYPPGRYRARDAKWAIGEVRAQNLKNYVTPGTLTLEIADGVIASQFQKRVQNETDSVIGVRDEIRYVNCQPGDSVGISAPGTLVVTAKIYFDSQKRPVQKHDADVHVPGEIVASREYKGNDRLIRVTPSGNVVGNFGLVGAILM